MDVVPLGVTFLSRLLAATRLASLGSDAPSLLSARPPRLRMYVPESQQSFCPQSHVHLPAHLLLLPPRPLVRHSLAAAPSVSRVVPLAADREGLGKPCVR